MSTSSALSRNPWLTPSAWRFELLGPTGAVVGNGFVIAPSAAGAQRTAEMFLAGLNRVRVTGPVLCEQSLSTPLTSRGGGEHNMAFLPPPQPPAQHRPADAQAAKRAQEYKRKQQEDDRRRREERERALIAESRRRASSTSQKR